MYTKLNHMDYTMMKEVITLLEDFDNENTGNSYSSDLAGFKAWVCAKESYRLRNEVDEPYWEGKEEGRSPESVISTFLVHLSRYAKTYSKSAISGSDFTTQEDFIYLITLKSFGAMTKIDLIRKNVHEKPAGMLIINRLIRQGWIAQADSDTDRRMKIIHITESGLLALENQMHKIRKATHVVSGNLSYSEKMHLIRLLNKLDKFHYPIFTRNIESEKLLDIVSKEYSFTKN